MDIPIYISELLDDQDYVVVPGLGAFLASYRPAGFNNGGSLLLPPSRMVSFYPEMKSNDGALAGIIAQHQKIPLSRASRLLEKFTGDILIRIEKGENAGLGTLGHLSMENGELKFTQGVESRQLPDTYGLSPLSIREMALTPASAESLEQAGNKKRIPVWAMAGLFLLLIGIPLVIWLTFSNGNPDETSIGQLPVKDTLPEQATFTPALPDSTDNQLYVGQSHEIRQNTSDSLFIHPRKELYYTIGGSYRAQQNASEYFVKMTAKGFHPIQLGLVQNFYLVALDTFFTAKEAHEAADQYDRTRGIWVYHPK